MHVEWARSVQRCTILRSAQTSMQDVDRMCASVYKLYTPSVANLYTSWEIEFISQTVSNLHTGSIQTCTPLGHVRAQGSFQAAHYPLSCCVTGVRSSWWRASPEHRCWWCRPSSGATYHQKRGRNSPLESGRMVVPWSWLLRQRLGSWCSIVYKELHSKLLTGFYM